MTKKESKGELTPEIIAWIKENQKVFFEISEVWHINMFTMYRWLRENRRPELSHPKTINIILKHNPGKIKIVQP
jgi:hypothetical protein